MTIRDGIQLALAVAVAAGWLVGSALADVRAMTGASVPVEPLAVVQPLGGAALTPGSTAPIRPRPAATAPDPSR